MAVPRVLKRLLSLPTASFVEDAVSDLLRQVCGRLEGVRITTDSVGNLLMRYRHRPRGPLPVIFTAHMDHPAFVAREMLDRRHARADFRGGVMAEYFEQARVRFYPPGGEEVTARVERVTRSREVKRGNQRWQIPLEVVLRTARPVPAGTPGMWDLPQPRERGDRLYARSCDDIAGCAAMVALLERLARKRARADVYCLFTRAEEVGFVGAIGAARLGTVPKSAPLIAIETSSELPDARIGAGPILRVGDRLSVFDPAATAFCRRVADRLAGRRRSFHYQRKLMDGGACESTAYCAYGYRATGICLALGNYHNMDKQRGRIAPEYISLSDWRLMVDWFEAIALADVEVLDVDPLLQSEMEKTFAQWQEYLP